MEVRDFFHILKRRKGAVIAAWLIFIVIGAAATFAQPLKHEAKSRLLIVQNISGVDPYTVSKSNQYLSSLFSQVVYSNSFFELVTSSNNFDIDRSYFTDNYKKQMKIWQKTISAKSNDAGIIEISIYHPNTYQAKQIALGVNDVLINQGFNYQGGDQTIKIKIIDQPLVSDYPVKPNIVFNFLAFSLLGVLAGCVYLYYTPNKKTGRQRAAQTAINKRQTYQTANPTYNLHTSYNPNNPIPSAAHHPAEKVMINEDLSEENIDEPVKGNIRNVINRF